MISAQRKASRELTAAEVEAVHLRKTRKGAIRDELRVAHGRYGRARLPSQQSGAIRYHIHDMQSSPAGTCR